MNGGLGKDSHTGVVFAQKNRYKDFGKVRSLLIKKFRTMKKMPMDELGSIGIIVLLAVKNTLSIHVAFSYRNHGAG